MKKTREQLEQELVEANEDMSFCIRKKGTYYDDNKKTTVTWHELYLRIEKIKMRINQCNQREIQKKYKKAP
jgi:prophage maintenance system killer protein